jgi:hypothetical protein
VKGGSLGDFKSDPECDRVEENKVKGYCLFAGVGVSALYGKLRANSC